MRDSGRWKLALAGIAALAAVLRFAALGRQSFDGDELYTAWLTGEPLGDLLADVGEYESTPHAFYLLTWAWTHLAGSSEAALRSVSALAGIGAVIAGALLARRLLGDRAGLLTGVLLATNPLLVWFSQQARAYSLLVLLCTLGALALAEVLRAGATSGRALLGWAAASAAALAVHYFAVFPVAAQAAWLLREARHRPERRRAIVLAVALPLAVGLALVPLAWHQRDNPGGIEGIAFLTRLAQVPKSFLVGFSPPAELAVTVAAALLVGAALLGLLRARRESIGALALPLAVAAVTVLVPAALAVVGVDFLAARNVLPAVVFCAVVVAGTAQTRWAAAAVAVYAALSVAVIVAGATDPSLQRADWRGVSRAVGDEGPARILAMTPGKDPGPFSVYFGGARTLSGDGAVVSRIDVAAVATEGAFGSGSPEPPPPPADVAAPRGFGLTEVHREETYTLLRFTAPRPRRVAPAELLPLVLDPGSGAALWLVGG